MERDDLIFCSMYQTCRRFICAASDMREGRYGGYAVRRGGIKRREFVVGGAFVVVRRGGRVNSVEEEGEPVAFLEEGEDELGTGVARAKPAQLMSIGARGGCGVIGYLGRGKVLVVSGKYLAKKTPLPKKDRRESGKATVPK